MVTKSGIPSEVQRIATKSVVIKRIKWRKLISKDQYILVRAPRHRKLDRMKFLTAVKYENNFVKV